MRACEYCRLQDALAQTGGSSEKALFEASVIIIMLSSEGAPNRPSFPPRNRALSVKGKEVIEAHRRNRYWN